MTDNLQKFIKGENIARFKLRDALEVGNFRQVTHIWTAARDDFLVHEESENSLCDFCFSDHRPKPLSLEYFDIAHEWFLETPPETQILLETFINRRSLFRTKTPGLFVKQKLEKLYRLYETLLNTYNKDFSGIFQQANTNNLLIEHKSISSVFDVTASSGTTTSLSSAETKLKEKADEDMCYYNTFLKRHSLLYDSLSGQKNQISLRDCHLILMLDNLVRLKFLTDPNPGEARSSQLCSLPITLQGMPVDSKITESWHQSECDGTEACSCKLPVVLCKADIERTLLEKDENEKDVYQRFFQLFTWGYPQLWKKLTDEILDQIEVKDSNEQSKHVEHATTSDNEQNYDDDESDTEDDIDLMQVLQQFEETEDTEDTRAAAEEIEDCEEDELLSDLEKSIEQMSVLDEDNVEQDSVTLQILSSFGFSKFIVPALLCRHPPPAVGRDDDVYKIKEILDDVYIKIGYAAAPQKAVNRILVVLTTK